MLLRAEAYRQGLSRRHVFAHAATSRFTPQSAWSRAFHRRREAWLVGELVGSLLAHAEELGDLEVRLIIRVRIRGSAYSRATVPSHRAGPVQHNPRCRGSAHPPARRKHAARGAAKADTD
jgi:hypothetical protein